MKQLCKLFLLFFIIIICRASTFAQDALISGEYNEGDYITIGGTMYILGSNLITNPSFESNPSKNDDVIIGWTVGNYAKMTTDSFNWIGCGGHDTGAYIQAKGNTGANGANSICQRWLLDTQSLYYFSFWLSNNSANNQYLPLVTLTANESTGGGQNEKISEGAKQLIGQPSGDVGEILGFGNFIDENGDGYGEWCQTGMTFSSKEYTYLQFNARWLKENKIQACFDDFHLHKLYRVENIEFKDSIVKQLCINNWDTNDDGELSTYEVSLVLDLGSAFRGNKIITSFDELKYFTGPVGGIKII